MENLKSLTRGVRIFGLGREAGSFGETVRVKTLI